MEALKAIYEEDFRVVDEREKSLRITIRSDDGSLSLDLLVRLREGERGRERERERELMIIAIMIHQGFIQDFWVGGEEVCGGSVCGRARARSTRALACVQARGVWGPGKKNFLDLLRLLLTQSETKFPAIILMTHRH